MNVILLKDRCNFSRSIRSIISAKLESEVPNKRSRAVSMSFGSKQMRNARAIISGFASVLLLASVCLITHGRVLVQSPETEFGPVVRAYLGYLRNEQEVVDNRVRPRE